MKKVRVTADAFTGDYYKLDEWQREAHQYDVTIEYGGRKMTVPFFMGSALTHAPTDEDVMPCLIADYYSMEMTDGFEDWAESLGHSPDSIKALDIYNQVLEQNRKLGELLGADIEEIMNQYEDL